MLIYEKGLDQRYKAKMACHCKESEIERSEIEGRTNNLYEDDDEYHETYMDNLVNPIVLTDFNQCSSTPSLPEVALATEICESKLEIPWLKISLPPPGFYEIKNVRVRPKNAVCDCWNLSPGDDVYTEKLVQSTTPDSRHESRSKEELSEELTSSAGEAPTKSSEESPRKEEKHYKTYEEIIKELDNDSESSLLSNCICEPEKEDCDDISPTPFVYDTSCLVQNEPYMDAIYNLYPEECDTYCGPHIEMPWSDLVIPKKIKLKTITRSRKEGKKDEAQSGRNQLRDDNACPGPSPIAVRSSPNSKQREDISGVEERALVPTNDTTVAAIPEDNTADKSFEIQLSFTEIISNMGAIDKSAPSGVSVSIKPCKDKCPVTESRTGSQSSKSRSSRCRKKKSKHKSCKCKSPSSTQDLSQGESVTSHACKCKTCSRQKTPSPKSKRSPDKFKTRKSGRYTDHVMNVLETCEAEMEPLRDTLNQLKSKIRNLNIPELSNWSAGVSNRCTPCISAGNSPVNLPLCTRPQSSQMSRPSSMPAPSQNYFTHPPPPQQFGFPPMHGMFPQPIHRPMALPRNCRPKCVCRDSRNPRKRSPKSASSSTDYSEYDSLSDGESLCPFLKALSSKNLYKDCCKGSKKGANQKKLPKTSPSKRRNKKSQAVCGQHDNCTDTEPEIQVYYGPKRSRVKTKQVFKGLYDPGNAIAKNQRLRIAVKVTPSGQAIQEDDMLAIEDCCS